MTISFTINGVTYAQQWKQCGRSCKRCPHGPYWQAFYWDHGKTKSVYVGKSLPREVEIHPMAQQALHKAGESSIPDRRSSCADKASAVKAKRLSLGQARKLLGIGRYDGQAIAMQLYLGLRDEVFQLGPSHDAEVREIDAAWKVVLLETDWKGKA